MKFKSIPTGAHVFDENISEAKSFALPARGKQGKPVDNTSKKGG